MDEKHSIFRFTTEQDPFPWLRPISYLFIVVGLVLMTQNIPVAVMVFGIGVFFMIGLKSTKVILDTNGKTVKTISGFSSQIDQFEDCQSIVISKKKMSQNINSRVSSTTVRYNVYQGHLMADEVYLLLAESRDRDELIQLLNTPAKNLGIQIEV